MPDPHHLYGLLCAEQATARVAKAGDDEAASIQLLINGGNVDLNVGVCSQDLIDPLLGSYLH